MFIERLLSTKTRDWAYGPIGNDTIRSLKADEEYFDVTIEAMRLVKQRKGFAKFHAAAHSFFSYGHQGQGRVEMQTLTAPTNLQNLDKRSLHKVLQLQQTVLGPVPYRGGSLGMEIGLFEVKTDDIGDSFLSFVTQVSDVAGVSYLESAKPILGLVKSGVDLLLSTDQASSLEVGIAQELSPPMTGTFAVIATDKSQIDFSKLSIDSSDRRLLLNGKSYEDTDYLIFSINPDTERTDWREIPDLLDSFNSVMAAIEVGEEKAKSALAALRLKTITTSDLLPHDGDKVYEIARDVYERAFSGGLVSDDGTRQDLPTYADIDIYGHGRKTVSHPN